MTTYQAVFIKSATRPKEYPQHDLPEIAFVGRSNVGKSSLLNALLSRKRLARVSTTPGRTRLLNFFHVNETFCFVDLPGFGYARVSKETRSTWPSMIENYLLKRQNLRLVILIIDIRTEPEEMEKSIFEWFQLHQTPFVVAFTKIDKIPKTKQQATFQARATRYGLSQYQAIACSSKTLDGMTEIWSQIMAAVRREA